MAKPRRPWTVTPHSPIEKLDDNLWAVTSQVPGLPVSRRMCVVKKSTGGLVFFHAVPLDEKTLAEVLAWGRPEALVVGHDQHAVDANGFREKLGVKVYTPKESVEKLREKVEVEGPIEALPSDPAIRFESIAGTKKAEPVGIVKSSDRVSLLFCDVVQNNAPGSGNLFLKVLGFNGPAPKVVPVFKMLFTSDRQALRAQIRELSTTRGLSRVVPCHGGVVESNAGAALRAAADAV